MILYKCTPFNYCENQKETTQKLVKPESRVSPGEKINRK